MMPYILAGWTDGTTLFFHDTSHIPDGYIYYKVSAYNSVGEGPKSPAIEVFSASASSSMLFDS